MHPALGHQCEKSVHKHCTQALWERIESARTCFLKEEMTNGPGNYHPPDHCSLPFGQMTEARRSIEKPSRGKQSCFQSVGKPDAVIEATWSKNARRLATTWQQRVYYSSGRFTLTAQSTGRKKARGNEVTLQANYIPLGTPSQKCNFSFK